MTSTGSGAGTATTDLVLLAQAGDRAALDELVTTHLPLIYNVVGRALNGDSDVDDLVQDTMMGIIRGLPELREPGRFRSWAVTIAYRRMQEHYRQRYRTSYRTVFRRVETDIPDPQADFAERTVSELALQGQRRELAQAARWLETADRHLFSLWWQEGAGELTRAELARAIDATPQHTAVRLQRMRQRLDGTRGLLRALNARPRCADLDDLVKTWDGRADSRWRKRLTRHTRDCAQCRPYARDLVSGESLLQGIGLVAVPALLLTKLPGAAAVNVVAVGKVSALFNSVAGKSAAAVGAAVITLGGVTYPLWTGPSSPAPVAPGLSSPAPSATAPATAVPTTSIIQSPTPTPTSTRTYAGVSTADLYVAPNGDDAARGSLAQPFATLEKAVSVVRPGQTIALRRGVYRSSQTLHIDTSGTSERRIVLSGYRDERPVLDLSGLPQDQWGIVQTGDFWTVQGLEITNAPSHAYMCESCHDNVFRRLDSHGNGASGLMLRGAGTSGNSIVNSDLHDNHDGLGIMYGAGTGNRISGVRTYRNQVEGIDLGGFTGPVSVRGTWSFGNGNGFTLGGGGTVVDVAHVLTDNAAWDNRGLGFNEEGNTGALELTRNTAYRNGVAGFWLPGSPAVLTRNLAAKNPDDAFSASARQVDNDWTATGFASLDPAGAEAGRRRDGSLPRTRFLVPSVARGARMNY
ncbi:sigma-70 family RNA polymerase sigma factor [Kineosporia sp. NBRC 101731]|uniref:sigma-70 family RNA polymerase sigma factor n=1 Tax=Kineosporia sp. NBRC 101731 TaxID=3032199 RepID=UPI0024A311E7|nr:sigma-70 family RNA polymerase sigma factor [Kineosporia sp. NBRC 101731]GLY30434.1 hypothetical protein Kisp02_37990 [Kineosporia sp. NBRC 101731]